MNIELIDLINHLEIKYYFQSSRKYKHAQSGYVALFEAFNEYGQDSSNINRCKEKTNYAILEFQKCGADFEEATSHWFLGILHYEKKDFTFSDHEYKRAIEKFNNVNERIRFDSYYIYKLEDQAKLKYYEEEINIRDITYKLQEEIDKIIPNRSSKIFQPPKRTKRRTESKGPKRRRPIIERRSQKKGTHITIPVDEEALRSLNLDSNPISDDSDLYDRLQDYNEEVKNNGFQERSSST
jgi:tetratricopeptide (TPR) repeat protein